MAQFIISTNPANGETLGKIERASAETINATVVRAKSAAKGWKKLTLTERLNIIRKAYAVAENAIEELGILLSREMGKDIRRATSEVRGTIRSGPSIAESALQALTSKQSAGTTIEYAPLGIAAIISPWNYPLAMANNLFIPALMAGNTVIWKPSEETPLIAQAFFDIIHKSFPENVLQIIHGDGEQGKMLVESDINMIGFTGSQAVGKQIMASAAGSLKRLVMELGGNDPLIVMQDADLESAARFAVAYSFENAGQMCISTERIYVDDSIADEFEQYVVSLASQYQVGPWDQEGVNIGPIINHKQHRRICEHIQDAVDKKGRLLLGNTENTEPYIKPTVIADVTEEMRVEQEETFGPVVCMSRYSDINEAVRKANNSDYGLGAVVFGGQDAAVVAEQLEAGMIGINQGVGGGHGTPWVGAKQSGYGFHGSAEGHRQFAQVRVVNY